MSVTNLNVKHDFMSFRVSFASCMRVTLTWNRSGPKISVSAPASIGRDAMPRRFDLENLDAAMKMPRGVAGSLGEWAARVRDAVASAAPDDFAALVAAAWGAGHVAPGVSAAVAADPVSPAAAPVAAARPAGGGPVRAAVRQASLF